VRRFISGGLEHTTSNILTKIENFSGKLSQQIYKQKDSLLTLKILLFYLKKEKITSTWKNAVFVQTSGLG
jgi:hypothetical protein